MIGFFRNGDISWESSTGRLYSWGLLYPELFQPQLLITKTTLELFFYKMLLLLLFYNSLEPDFFLSVVVGEE